IFERQDNIDESLAEYKKALDSATGQAREIPQKNLANMYNNRGRKLQAAGQLDAARSALEEAMRLDPTHPMYHNNLG
ncbi:tetratricopeptide repeat protein, partial [Acinetobacter baumannii]